MEKLVKTPKINNLLILRENLKLNEKLAKTPKINNIWFYGKIWSWGKSSLRWKWINLTRLEKLKLRAKTVKTRQNAVFYNLLNFEQNLVKSKRVKNTSVEVIFLPIFDENILSILAKSIWKGKSREIRVRQKLVKKSLLCLTRFSYTLFRYKIKIKLCKLNNYLLDLVSIPA